MAVISLFEVLSGGHSSELLHRGCLALVHIAYACWTERMTMTRVFRQIGESCHTRFAERHGSCGGRRFGYMDRPVRIPLRRACEPILAGHSVCFPRDSMIALAVFRDSRCVPLYFFRNKYEMNVRGSSQGVHQDCPSLCIRSLFRSQPRQLRLSCMLENTLCTSARGSRSYLIRIRGFVDNLT